MIFHLAVDREWDVGNYRPESLVSEGFIHCSTAAQLTDVANALYSGRRDLVLVTIDEPSVTAPIVWEDCYETGQRFPHIYGSINPEAVIEVAPFPPSEEGVFAWRG